MCSNAVCLCHSDAHAADKALGLNKAIIRGTAPSPQRLLSISGTANRQVQACVSALYVVDAAVVAPDSTSALALEAPVSVADAEPQLTLTHWLSLT